MPAARRTSIRVCLFLVAVMTCVALALAQAPAQPASGYTPAAPPAALLAALRSQLGVVRDWVNEKDFASANQALAGLYPLTELAAVQSEQPEWTKAIARLRVLNGGLSTAVKNKDSAAAVTSIADAGGIFDEMAKVPGAAKRSVANFKFPGGSTKTWMSLLDGAYVDAKSTKTARDLELLAGALAEESNALAHMKSDARWKTDALALRDMALKAAEQAKGGDLEAGRQALKGIYNSCEACHDRTRKK